MNTRGTIYAYDLVELPESEDVRWLQEFGVIGAKRMVNRVGAKVKNIPLWILTFNMPLCPTHLKFDYMSYQVRQYIPNIPSSATDVANLGQ